METHPFLTKWKDRFGDRSEWVIKKDTRGEVSCFGFIPENAQYLIIGTFPAYKVINEDKKSNYRFDFFYGSAADNGKTGSDFWNYLGLVFGCEFQDEEDIFSFLVDHKIGICDILMEIEREGSSSQDVDLTALKKNAIDEILIEHASIDHILFTSGGSLALGKSAAGWSSDVLKRLLVQGRKSFRYLHREYRFDLIDPEVIALNREFAIHYLLSPSDSSWQSSAATINKVVSQTGMETNEIENKLAKFLCISKDQYSLADMLIILQWQQQFSDSGIKNDVGSMHDLVIQIISG